MEKGVDRIYKEGHAGLSLLLFAPFVLLFRLLGLDLSHVIITGGLMVALSSVPDLDMEYRKYGIKHRGITHTLLFGVGVGVLIAVVMAYAFGFPGVFMGFLAGFGGTASHLLGDAFTYSSFRPFRPFSNREVAYRVFKASNRKVNGAMLTIGTLAVAGAFLV
jgi:inner membrane protein